MAKEDIRHRSSKAVDTFFSEKNDNNLCGWV
jgi:hypothetical protein